MDFFNLRDKLDEFRYSCTPGEKLKNGAKIFGTVLANTAIAAGKAAAVVVEQIPEQIEKQKNKR